MYCLCKTKDWFVNTHFKRSLIRSLTVSVAKHNWAPLSLVSSFKLYCSEGLADHPTQWQNPGYTSLCISFSSSQSSSSPFHLHHHSHHSRPNSGEPHGSSENSHTRPHPNKYDHWNSNNNSTDMIPDISISNSITSVSLISRNSLNGIW